MTIISDIKQEIVMEKHIVFLFLIVASHWMRKEKKQKKVYLFGYLTKKQYLCTRI